MRALERNLGKGEVVSSILTGSTDKMGISSKPPAQNHAEQSRKMQDKTHQIRTKIPLRSRGQTKREHQCVRY